MSLDLSDDEIHGLIA